MTPPNPCPQHFSQQRYLQDIISRSFAIRASDYCWHGQYPVTQGRGITNSVNVSNRHFTAQGSPPNFFSQIPTTGSHHLPPESMWFFSARFLAWLARHLFVHAPGQTSSVPHPPANTGFIRPSHCTLASSHGGVWSPGILNWLFGCWTPPDNIRHSNTPDFTGERQPSDGATASGEGDCVRFWWRRDIATTDCGPAAMPTHFAHQVPCAFYCSRGGSSPLIAHTTPRQSGSRHQTTGLTSPAKRIAPDINHTHQNRRARPATRMGREIIKREHRNLTTRNL